MGFIKRNGHWERKNQSEERATDADAPGPSIRRSSSVHHDSVPAPAPASPTDLSTPLPAPLFTSTSVTFSDAQLVQLKNLLTAQKEELKVEIRKEIEEKFMDVKLSLQSLEEKVLKMDTILGSSCESLKIDLKGIFDGLENIGGDSKTYAQCNAELQDKILAATTYLDRKLNEFVLTQSQGMGRIVEDLQRILRTN